MTASHSFASEKLARLLSGLGGAIPPDQVMRHVSGQVAGGLLRCAPEINAKVGAVVDDWIAGAMTAGSAVDTLNTILEEHKPA